MNKFYSLSILLMLVLILVSSLTYAQPADKRIIFVGAAADAADPEDSVAIDSIAKWIANVDYMGVLAFNSATADDLYGAGGKGAQGVIISESIGSDGVPNFGLRDEYPVPLVLMELSVFTNDAAANPTKWPLLRAKPDGGVWGYGSPIAEDVQWKITDQIHYITEGYAAEDVISYAPEAGRGVPYLYGIDASHTILAVGGRTAGEAGEDPPYDQDQAAAVAVLDDPKIAIINTAYTYLAVGTTDFYKILRRTCEFMFDFMPVEAVDHLLADEINLSIFPNPATSDASVSFSIEAGRNISINVFSVTGGLIGNVYEGISVAGKNLVHFNTANYTAGVYFVELQIDNEVTYSKLVVQ